MNDTMEVLAPQGSAVQYRGERLEIRPLTIGQLPPLVRTARPVLDGLLSLEALPGEDDLGGMLDVVMDLVELHGEAVFAAAAICTDREPAWIAGGDLGEFYDLAMKVIEVNRDFFVQRLGPLLASRATQQNDGAGPTASSS